MHPFRNLLLISLGRESSFRKDPTPKDWAVMFKMARQQALIGVCYDGVCRVPEHQRPPQDIMSAWSRLTERIADIYRLHVRRTQEMIPLLEQLGFHGTILKGTALSRIYPVPERRMCGDVDVWVTGTHRSILKALRPSWHPYDIVYQECKVNFFPDVEVEIHFHPGKMYNPFLNARLQRYLEKESPIRDDKTLMMPSPRFDAVYCMAHMFHHYLEGGIGLRQMMDYYYTLRLLDPADREPVMKALRRLGMGRFTAAMMESLWFNFGLEEEYFLCPRDPKLGTDGRNHHRRQFRGGGPAQLPEGQRDPSAPVLPEIIPRPFPSEPVSPRGDLGALRPPRTLFLAAFPGVSLEDQSDDPVQEGDA